MRSLVARLRARIARLDSTREYLEAMEANRAARAAALRRYDAEHGTSLASLVVPPATFAPPPVPGVPPTDFDG